MFSTEFAQVEIEDLFFFGDWINTAISVRFMWRTGLTLATAKQADRHLDKIAFDTAVL